MHGIKRAARRQAGSASDDPAEEVELSAASCQSNTRESSSSHVSSPSQWSQPHSFLSVPSGRSRGGIVYTDGNSSSTSDFTYSNIQTLSNSSKGFGTSVYEGEHPILSDEEALRPNPGIEDDFHRDNNPFAFTPGQMSKLFNPKSLGAFHALGGLAGLEKGLRTDTSQGLSIDSKEGMQHASFPKSRGFLGDIPPVKSKRSASSDLSRLIDSTSSGQSRSHKYSAGRSSRIIVSGVERQRSFTQHRRHDHVAPGSLSGYDDLALVDTGAENLVSEDFPGLKGISWERQETKSILLADGYRFHTLGTVCLPWTFQGEDSSYLVDFHVIPKKFCQYAITLGGMFMKRTRSLQDYVRRIVRVPRKSLIPRVRLQGSGQLRINGYCDGLSVSALPDSASDVPLMSRAYAESMGKTIDESPEHCIQLLLPGGRIVSTSGIARGCQWGWDHEDPNYVDVHYVDFYILDNLVTDVLLDESFLEDTEAFEQYSDQLSELSLLSGQEECGTFFTIQRYIQARKSKRLDTAQIAKRQVESYNTSLINELRTLRSSSLSDEEKIVQERRLNQLLLQAERAGHPPEAGTNPNVITAIAQDNPPPDLHLHPSSLSTDSDSSNAIDSGSASAASTSPNADPGPPVPSPRSVKVD